MIELNQQEELAQMRELLARQGAQIEALQGEITRMKQSQAAGNGSPKAKATGQSSRRQALQKMAGLAAGVALVGTASGAAPAKAATGQPLVIGVTNKPTSNADTTVLQSPTNFMPTVFRVNNVGASSSGGPGVPPAPFPLPERTSVALVASIVGTDDFGRPTAKIGILGGTDDGTAIQGETKGQGVGVKGYSPGGPGVQGLSISGDGVNGNVSSGYGVNGFSNSGTGVNGSSNTGTGMQGASNKGVGVSGTGNMMAGVQGNSTSGPGVLGNSTNGVGGVFGGASAQLFLIPGQVSGPPTTGQHAAGEFYVDSIARLYFCTTSGTPGTWRRVLLINSRSKGNETD